MFVPDSNHLNQVPLGGFQAASGTLNQAWGNDDTQHDVSKEWRNPHVVIGTVLMLVGGDVIRTALAQTAGKHFTPVCFSFGWVSYALATVVDVFGSGRLLPAPDYPVKVFNVTSGYSRENRNWAIGRIVRDHQSWISRKEPLSDNAIRIAVLEAEPNPGKYNSFCYNRLHIFGALTMATQLIIASVPTILTGGREFGVLAVTIVGTALALVMGSLPQWKAEKLPNGHQSHQIYALTAGGGSRDVMIIKGQGNCLNLEELAASESPENDHPWIKFNRFSMKRKNSMSKSSKEVLGIPQGFFITRFVVVVLALFWILLFITIPGLEGHTWYLIAVGGIGLFHNALIAGMKRRPEERNLPLNFKDIIVTRKVMDGLMDLEVSFPTCGKALLGEFFPGELLLDEKTWWVAAPSERPESNYDKKRYEERKKRLWPRSMLQDGAQIGEPDLHRAESPSHVLDLQDQPGPRPGSRRGSKSIIAGTGLSKRATPGRQQPDTSAKTNTASQDRSKLSVPRDDSRTKSWAAQTPVLASLDEIMVDSVANSNKSQRESASKRPETWDKLTKPPNWD